MFRLSPDSPGGRAIFPNQRYITPATIHSSLARYTPALGAGHTCPIDVSLFDTRLKCAEGPPLFPFPFPFFFSPHFSFSANFFTVQSFDLSAFSIYVDNICNKRGNSMRFLFIFRNFLSASTYFIPYFIVRNFNAISSYTAHYSSKLFFKKQRRYWQTYKIAPYPRTCRRSTLYEGDSFSRSR